MTSSSKNYAHKRTILIGGISRALKYARWRLALFLRERSFLTYTLVSHLHAHF